MRDDKQDCFAGASAAALAGGAVEGLRSATTVREAQHDAHADVLDIWRRALLLGLGLAFLAMGTLPPLLHFTVDVRSFPVLVLALVPIAFLPYVTWRRMRTLRTILEIAAATILVPLPITVITYAAMRLGMPLADTALIRMDAMLGFDWPAFVRWVDARPTIAVMLQHGYSAFSFQVLLLPMVLIAVGLQKRAYQFVLGFLLLCVLAAIVSVPFPSEGAYVAHGLDGKSLHHINSHFGYFFLESFRAVREQDLFVLSSHNVGGIITFPSVHAAVAVLCAWAAWPSRLLRYPLLFVNILMFVSALTHGAHYLVDILAGGGIAVLAIWIVLVVGPTFQRRAAN